LDADDAGKPYQADALSSRTDEDRRENPMVLPNGTRDSNWPKVISEMVGQTCGFAALSAVAAAGVRRQQDSNRKTDGYLDNLLN
jgi:hypothetical protein